MLTIIDYGGGNLFSVQLALKYLGIKSIISSCPKEIISSERILFPGVGTSAATMCLLNNKGIDKVLKDFFDMGKPILGICIGCQLFLDHSEEDGGVDGLGFIHGEVKKFPIQENVKIPHMGWNTIDIRKNHPVLNGISSGDYFYFAHSYFPHLANKEYILASTQHGKQEFTTIFAKKNLFTCQFHPEKSAEKGLVLLKNFNDWDGQC